MLVWMCEKPLELNVLALPVSPPPPPRLGFTAETLVLFGDIENK